MMRFSVLFVVLALLVIVPPALADTETPTPTPSPTPDVYQVMLLSTPEGTEQPAQAVAFGYEANTGDVVIAVLVGALVFSAWAAIIIWLLIGRRSS